MHLSVKIFAPSLGFTYPTPSTYDTLPQKVPVAWLEKAKGPSGLLLPYPLCLLLVPSLGAPPVVPPEFILSCLRVSSIGSFFNPDTSLCFRGVLPVATRLPSTSEERGISDTTSQSSVPSGTVSDQTALARLLPTGGKGRNKTPSRRTQCLQT